MEEPIQVSMPKEATEPVVEEEPPAKVELDAVPESANVSHVSASVEEVL